MNRHAKDGSHPSVQNTSLRVPSQPDASQTVVKRPPSQKTAVDVPTLAGGPLSGPELKTPELAKSKPPRSANEELWDQAQAQLHDEEPWKAFESEFRDDPNNPGTLSMEGIVASFTSLKATKDKEKWVAITINGKAIRPRDVVDSIVGFASDFKDLGDTLAGCDPTQSAGLAWGILQFFVSLAVKNKEVHDLVESHEKVASLMYRSAIYAELYLGSSSHTNPLKSGPLMADCLLAVYVSVLRYFMTSWKFLKQHMWNHALSSLSPEHAVKSSLSAIGEASEELDKTGRTAHAEVTVNMRMVSVETRSDISRLLELLGKVQSPVAQVVDQLFSAERDKILDWISPTRHWERPEELKSSEGTGKWLFEDESFKQWEQTDGSGLIWLRGKMGSGKSTIASLVLNHFYSQFSVDKRKQVAFFFCDRTSRAGQIESSELIIRSILKQMLRLHQRDIPDPVKKEYDSKKSDGSLSETVCNESIVKLLEANEMTMLILDGLDECDPEVREQIIKRLVIPLLLQQQKVKVFISSRVEQDIDHLFDDSSPMKCPKWTFTMSNSQDIQSYIESEVQRFRPELRDTIKAELIKKSGNMFRWVQLSIQMLKRKGGSEEVLRRLNSLPRKLEGLYAAVYAEISELGKKDFERVYHIILLLMYQKTRLRTIEVVEAAFGSCDNVQLPDLAIQLFEFASDFIEYDEETDEWRLAHLSVKEYLESRTEYRPQQAHARIAVLCLSRVGDWFSTTPPAEQRTWEIDHFICYALTQWPFHLWQAREMIHGDRKLRKALRRSRDPLTKSKSLIQWIDDVLEKIKTGEIAPSNADTSQSVAQSTREDVDSSSSSSSSDEEERATSGGDPNMGHPPNPKLEIATMTTCSNPPNPLFAYAQWRVVELLEPSSMPSWIWDRIYNSNSKTAAEEISNWSDLSSMTQCFNQMPPTALMSLVNTVAPMRRIIEHGPGNEQEDMLVMFLNSGGRINQEFAFMQNAVHLAAYHFKPNILKALIDRGLEVNAKDWQGRTPLHHVFRPDLAILDEDNIQDEDQLRCMQILIDAKIEVTCEDDFGKSAIFLATERGSAVAVKLLLDNGANVNTQDRSGYSLLCIALLNRRKNSTVVLLEAGADANAKEPDGDHVLTRAILIGDTAIIELLLAKGADPTAVDVTDGSNDSMLHVAVVSRSADNIAVAKIFLEKGLNINSKNARGWTPLHKLARVGTKAEIVKFLLDNKADVNAVTNNGATPLHVAASNGREICILDTLIKGQAKVNATDRHGATPLHEAVRLTCLGIWADEALAACRFLLDHGADVLMRTAQGLSILVIIAATELNNPLLYKPDDIARTEALRIELLRLIRERTVPAIASLRKEIEVLSQDLPFPPGCEERRTKEGRRYFVDHNHKDSSWTDPRVQRPFPEGSELGSKIELYDDVMSEETEYQKVLQKVSQQQARALQRA